MYKDKYALICKLKYEKILHEICSNVQYTICKNMHKYANKKYAIYVHIKLKYAEIYKNKISKYMQTYHMHKYAQNVHKYANQICTNMHFQNMHKYVFYLHNYALYAWICRGVNMPLYAN